MTNVLVFSDIHANAEALRAVLDHAQRQHGLPDAIWCLGDIMGYGPDPALCLSLLRGGHPLTQAVQPVFVLGNHDLGTLQSSQGRVDDTVSSSVRQSWAWTAQVLDDEQRAFLANLPDRQVLSDLPQSVLLVHAAPPNDVHTYLRGPTDVEARLANLEQQICFFGHTHLACYFECDRVRYEAKPRLFPWAADEPVVLRADRLFINPGSVGQPRWGRLIPKQPHDQSAYPAAYQGVTAASYLWVDLQAATCTVWCHYVAYDFEKTVAKLQALVYQNPPLAVPDRWLTRLRLGLR